MKEKLDIGEDKGKEVVEEDIEPEPNPQVQEEPFLKPIKELSGKSLKGIPLFMGKMDILEYQHN